MPGFLECKETVGAAERTVRYCIVPTVLPPTFRGKEYFPGLFIDDKPRLTPDASAFLDEFGKPVPDAVPVFERDLWVKHDVLRTIEQWPIYPFSIALLSRIPMAVVDDIIANTGTDWVTKRGRGTFTVKWGGLSLSRGYKVDELRIGAAIWPPRALPKWKQYFVLLAPGDRDLVNATPFTASVSSGELQPVVYAVEHRTLVPGDTAIVHGGRAAILRSVEVPRMVALKVGNAPVPEHGIMPLLPETQDNTFGIPSNSPSNRRSIFGDLRLSEPTRSPSTVFVSVDFGTTNTALAAATEPDTEGDVIEFGDELLVKKLTPWLDPGQFLDARIGFFPMNRRPGNPLPSVLVELDNRVVFPGQNALPRYSLLGDDLGAEHIVHWIRKGYLHQEFKWQTTSDAPQLRAAFLECLARLVGFHLRVTPAFQAYSKVQIVFTRPLSFSHRQTAQMIDVQDKFKAALTDCGFEVSLRQRLVSESQANLYLIRQRPAGAGGILPEERHVVVDIGGGSTDIAVFAGTGEPLWLDSLYIGGKDLAEAVLLKRLRALGEQDRSAALQTLFTPTAFSATANLPSDDPKAGRMLQQLLLLRLVRDIANVAGGFDGALAGTPADFVALLAFATAYGVKMAALPASIDQRVFPVATSIMVWFVGLGSRLFELTPPAIGMNSRLDAARVLLEKCCHRVAPHAPRIRFDWRPASDAKLTVCKGALLVPDAESVGLKTLFWADFPTAQPSIEWTHLYNHNRVLQSTDDERRHIQTAALNECIAAAIESIAKTIGFGASAPSSELAEALNSAYKAGAGYVVENHPSAPPHPVKTVTETLKDNFAGLMKPIEGRQAE